MTVSMISSDELVLMHTGNASTPANSLNNSALPSITGIAASGPMSPRPRTAEPSETMATVFFLMVRSWARRGSSWMAMQIRATPGVYAIDRSCMSLTGASGSTSILPPSCMWNVRSYQNMRSTPSRASTAATTRLAWSSSLQLTTTSLTRTSPRTSNPPIDTMLAPAAPMAVASRPRVLGTLASST